MNQPAPQPLRRRYCLHAQVDPARLGEYRLRHAAVWPEMLHALKDAGWHNYSLFLRSDGLLIAHVESEDLDAAQAAMAATEVNTRWQEEMSEFFVGIDSTPDVGFQPIEEVFHLETQLAATSEGPEGELKT